MRRDLIDLSGRDGRQHMQRIIQIGVIVGIVAVSALTGSSNIDSTDKHAWSENAG